MEKDFEILKAIAIRFPYDLRIVEKVFDRIKSYDKTIKICQLACRSNVDIFEMVRLSEEGLVKLQSTDKLKALEDAALDFIRKVDSGEARSTDSYNKFKNALQIK